MKGNVRMSTKLLKQNISIWSTRPMRPMRRSCKDGYHADVITLFSYIDCCGEIGKSIRVLSAGDDQLFLHILSESQELIWWLRYAWLYIIKVRKSKQGLFKTCRNQQSILGTKLTRTNRKAFKLIIGQQTRWPIYCKHFLFYSFIIFEIFIDIYCALYVGIQLIITHTMRHPASMILPNQFPWSGITWLGLHWFLLVVRYRLVISKHHLLFSIDVGIRHAIIGVINRPLKLTWKQLQSLVSSSIKASLKRISRHGM